MEKLVYVMQQPADRPGPDLRKALIDSVVPAIRAAAGTLVSVNVADEDVAQGEKVAILKSDPPIRSMISFWMQNSDDREAAETALRAESSGCFGYLVAESRPLVHVPPVGARAPGANLVTCITKRADISDEQFIDRWNNEHREVAVEIQSTFAYVRNAVVRRLTPDAPDFDGVVEESFPIEALTDPHVWYDCSDADEYKRRVQRMVASVQAFLDLSKIESVPMSEYYLG